MSSRFDRGFGIATAIMLIVYVAWVAFIIWAIYTLVTWIVSK